MSVTETSSGAPFVTSLPALNAALSPHLAPGNLIICTGLTGGGKTIFAGSLAAEFAMAGHKTLFMSTEVEYAELYKRMISAKASIPYDDIMDRIALVRIAFGDSSMKIPDPKVYGIEETHRAFKLLAALRRNLAFFQGMLSVIPLDEAILRQLESFRSTVGCEPAALIYDYLRAPTSEPREVPDPFVRRAAVLGATEALRTVAKQHGLLVIAFCQADQTLGQSEKVSASDIGEFKDIALMADAFIGISHRAKNVTGETNNLWEPVQHFTISTTTRPAEQLVPVLTNFAYQRFDPYEGGNEGKDKGRKRPPNTVHHGYVLARHDNIRQLFTCDVPYAVNLYAFLLLAGKTEGRDVGLSFYSRVALQTALGLTSKQLRRATKVLKSWGYIDVTDKGSRKPLHYQISLWVEDQDPAASGWFKLFHNLRDESRRDLLANPTVFRVWLYLLCEARQRPHGDTFLVPGELLLEPEIVLETLQIASTDLFAALEQLQSRGSITRSTANPLKVHITNWLAYQTEFYPRIPIKEAA